MIIFFEWCVPKLPSGKLETMASAEFLPKIFGKN